mmetsp:Transcript_10355/g.21284  ORF Transcript_10355/g.21284 Transcript_10355/m.21284 type:complete len:251 (-) Transcript_10355:1288-2040(-)
MSVLTPQQIWIQARLPPRCTPGRNLVSRTQPVPITLFLSGRADGASGTTRRDFNVRTVQCGSYRTGSKVARTHTRTGYAYLSSFACRTSNESLSQQKNLDSTSRVTCGHVCPVARCSRMRCATISLTPSPRLMRWPWTLATACHTSAPWSTLNMLICSRESASLCHLRLSSCTCNHPSAQDMGQRTMSARKTRTPHPQCPRTMTTPTHITSHHIAPNIDDPPPRAVHATRTCMRGSHPTHTDRKSRRAAL